MKMKTENIDVLTGKARWCLSVTLTSLSKER